MQNWEDKEQILKIFSKVRCFSKDQLPRYVDGRLTHMEKHLLEQHLVNCELCSDAVEILQKPKFQAQYQTMGQKVQQYIRKSDDVAPVHEAERYQKNVQIRENVLTYFWGAVGALLFVGCFYLVQQQVKKEKVQNELAQASGQQFSVNAADSAANSLAATPPATPAKDTVKPAAATTATTEATADADKTLYKTAMTFYHDGNLDEAMPRFTQLTADSTSRYREMAHYQLAMCFKFKRQKVKARRLFKELVEMNGPMKKRAQLALNQL